LSSSFSPQRPEPGRCVTRTLGHGAVEVLPYCIGYAMPLSVLLGYFWGGLWTFQTVVGVFVIVPVMDLVASRCRSGRAGEGYVKPESAAAFRLVTWIWVPVQFALLGWSLHVASSETLSALERLGLTLSVGLTTGCIGITFAHELMHQRGRFERSLAEALMTSVSYPHFCVAHVSGHHVDVGTPRDPATARPGESFYAFLPRAVGGSLRCAWGIEARRLRGFALPPYGPRNRMLRHAIVLAAIYAYAGWAFGARGVAFFLGESAVAIGLLEVINYVEHYGLFRCELAPGRYEPVEACHSWSSDHLVSNLILINLARHADHHARVGRSYQTLEPLHERAPQLPWGYGTMVVLALVPPLWRRIMDHRALKWQRGTHGDMRTGT